MALRTTRIPAPTVLGYKIVNADDPRAVQVDDPDARPAIAGMTRPAIAGMTRSEIVEELKAAGLLATGTNQELALRIVAHREKQGEGQ